MRRSGILILALFPCLIARGAEKAAYCPAAASLSATAQFCVDNTVFAREAAACVERLQRAVKEAGDALAERYRKNAPTDGAQTAKLADTVMDYALSAAELDRLIEDHRTAVSDLGEYLRNLNFPVDARDALEKPCYGDAFRAVEGSRRKAAEGLRQLEATRTATLKKKVFSSARQGALSGSTPGAAAPVPGAKGPGPSGGGAKRSGGAGSDITGTKEDASGNKAP